MVEEFSLVEIRMGHRLSDDAGVFFYLGLDDYNGAAAEDSPLVFSKNGDFFSAGEKITDPNLVNDHSAQFGKPHHKAHLHFQWKDFEIWAHSTRGSIQYINIRHFIEREGSFVDSARSLEYQQVTLAAKQNISLSEQISLTLDGGYDLFDVVNNQSRSADDPDFKNRSALRENELNLRAQLNWEIDPSMMLAGGLEYSREWFGKDAEFISNDTAHLARNPTPEWRTETYSLVAEYQWNLNQQWTFFGGGRADHHTYTDWMYSPKFAVVFSPHTNHQLKLIVNRGVRKSEDPELKRQNDQNLDPEIENIEFVELRHDWQVNKQISNGLTLFHYRHEILGFLPQAGRETDVGEASINGIELELTYKTDSFEISLSHAYTNLLDFDLHDPSLLNQVVTSEPYGYGDDLANWSPHLSKLNGHWQLNEQWGFDSGFSLSLM